MRLGDLDALKKAACVKFYTTPYYKHILDLIDNAPTVNSRDKACEDCIYFDKPTTLEPCRHCTFAYKSCFKGKAKDERPQGEWKPKTDIDGFTYCVCSSCNWLNCGDELNFCPNCGADMKGDTE